MMDRIDKLKENMTEALKSLLAQRKTLLNKHKRERDDINKEIKKVEDDILGVDKYEKHPHS